MSAGIDVDAIAYTQHYFIEGTSTGNATAPGDFFTSTKLLKDKSIGVDDICATLKISKSTLYRYAEIGRHGSPSTVKGHDIETT